jgi:hypothetical protein
MSKDNVKTGQQGTDRPWERPAQASQDLAIEPARREQRERDYATMAPGKSPAPDASSVDRRPPIPRRIEDRPTEDDLAQAALGGPKGSPELPPAPLTKTEKEQNLFSDEPGHVA